MIDTAAKKTAKWLLSTGAISSSDVQLYEYAAYCLFFNLIPFALVSVIGGLMGMPAEGLLMIVPFILIRKFSGGFHLSSPLSCFISSTIFLSLFLLFVKLTIAYRLFMYHVCLVATAELCVFLLSPIDSAARRLSAEEVKAFRKIARIVSVSILLVYVVFSIVGMYRVSIPIGTGIIITAILQLPCMVHTSQSEN